MLLIISLLHLLYTILRIPKAVCDDSKFPYDLSSSKKVIVQIVKQGLLIREATEQDAVEIQRKSLG